MALIGFANQQKAASDIRDIALDWTPFVPTGATFSAHSVSVDSGDVTATDRGVSGFTQTVRVSGGTAVSHSVVIAHVTLTSSGVDLSRAFIVSVF